MHYFYILVNWLAKYYHVLRRRMGTIIDHIDGSFHKRGRHGRLKYLCNARYNAIHAGLRLLRGQQFDHWEYDRGKQSLVRLALRPNTVGYDDFLHNCVHDTSIPIHP